MMKTTSAVLMALFGYASYEEVQATGVQSFI
jgi:hypothetical protein